MRVPFEPQPVKFHSDFSRTSRIQRPLYHEDMNTLYLINLYNSFGPSQRVLNNQKEQIAEIKESLNHAESRGDELAMYNMANMLNNTRYFTTKLQSELLLFRNLFSTAHCLRVSGLLRFTALGYNDAISSNIISMILPHGCFMKITSKRGFSTQTRDIVHVTPYNFSRSGTCLHMAYTFLDTRKLTIMKTVGDAIAESKKRVSKKQRRKEASNFFY